MIETSGIITEKYESVKRTATIRSALLTKNRRCESPVYWEKPKIYFITPLLLRIGEIRFLHAAEASAYLFSFLYGYTSSFLEPISVRNRSANRAASKGFLNVSLILERSILAAEPSSGKRAIRITSLNSPFLRRF